MNKPKIKEYTVNLDVQVFAEDIENAFCKLNKAVAEAEGLGRFWTGEIKEETEV